MLRVETHVVCLSDVRELVEPKAHADAPLKSVQEALAAIASEAVSADASEAQAESEEVDEASASDVSDGCDWRRRQGRGHSSMPALGEDDEFAYEFEDVDEDDDYPDDGQVLLDAVVAVGLLDAAAGLQLPRPWQRERRRRAKGGGDDEGEEGRRDDQAGVPGLEGAPVANRRPAGSLEQALKDAAALLNQSLWPSPPEADPGTPGFELQRRRRRALSLRRRR